MSSVNKVILVGRLGRDPETRYSQSGTAMCNISIATDYRSKQQDGSYKEETEWHRVVLFSRLAEIADKYLKKGSQVYIEGRLRTRKWQGQDGQDRYSTEIVADQMQMLGGRHESQQTSGSQQQNTSQQGQPKRDYVAQNQGAPNYSSAPDAGGFDDEPPF